MTCAFDTLGLANAEAHAEAARDFVMAELVTKTDLLAATASLRQEIENQTLRMTVRLGGIVAIGVAVLAAIIKL